MKTKRLQGWMGGVGVTLMLLWAVPVWAQTFSSGSTGADGAFAPTANTTVTLPADGVLNYTRVNIPSGVTVTFAKNAANTPVTMLVTGDVTIAGTLNLNGATGIGGFSLPGPVVNLGGVGGPGGFPGGQGGARGPTNNNGSAGQGPGGSNPGADGSTVQGATYGAPSSFVSLIPLFGGSGGGGTNGGENLTGGSGGGGGGAIVLASTTKITVTGSIVANGGGQDVGCHTSGTGNGSGGAIRLIAPQISTSGTLQATSGAGSCSPGGPGRIRIETFVIGQIAPTVPPASISNALGPVTVASTPALSNPPTLTISSVGGAVSPAMPSGSFTTADVSLPQGTNNPVTVTLAANNIPVGAIFTVKLIPQFAAPTIVSSSPSTGTFSNATANANVSLPSGQVSVLNAHVSFTLPQQTAALFPLIDGEPVERVLLAAGYGEASTLTLITPSGKEKRMDQLAGDDQRKATRALEVMSMLYAARD